MRYIFLSLATMFFAIGSLISMENNKNFKRAIITNFMLINEIPKKLEMIIPVEITKIIQRYLYNVYPRFKELTVCSDATDSLYFANNNRWWCGGEMANLQHFTINYAFKLNTKSINEVFTDIVPVALMINNESHALLFKYAIATFLKPFVAIDSNMVEQLRPIFKNKSPFSMVYKHNQKTTMYYIIETINHDWKAGGYYGLGKMGNKISRDGENLIERSYKKQYDLNCLIKNYVKNKSLVFDKIEKDLTTLKSYQSDKFTFIRFQQKLIQAIPIIENKVKETIKAKERIKTYHTYVTPHKYSVACLIEQINDIVINLFPIMFKGRSKIYCKLRDLFIDIINNIKKARFDPKKSFAEEQQLLISLIDCFNKCPDISDYNRKMLDEIMKEYNKNNHYTILNSFIKKYENDDIIIKNNTQELEEDLNKLKDYFKIYIDAKELEDDLEKLKYFRENLLEGIERAIDKITLRSSNNKKMLKYGEILTKFQETNQLIFTELFETHFNHLQQYAEGIQKDIGLSMDIILEEEKQLAKDIDQFLKPFNEAYNQINATIDKFQNNPLCTNEMLQNAVQDANNLITILNDNFVINTSHNQLYQRTIDAIINFIKNLFLVVTTKKETSTEIKKSALLVLFKVYNNVQTIKDSQHPQFFNCLDQALENVVYKHIKKEKIKQLWSEVNSSGQSDDDLKNTLFKTLENLRKEHLQSIINFANNQKKLQETGLNLLRQFLKTLENNIDQADEGANEGANEPPNIIEISEKSKKSEKQENNIDQKSIEHAIKQLKTKIIKKEELEKTSWFMLTIFPIMKSILCSPIILLCYLKKRIIDGIFYFKALFFAKCF